MPVPLWRFYLAASLMSLGVSLGFFSITMNATLLGASPIVLGGAIGAGTGLVYAFACQGAGRLVQRFGPKPVLAPGCLVMSVSYAQLAWVKFLPAVVAISIVAGASMSLFWPALQAWLAEGRESEELGKVLPGFNLSWGFAGVFGPLVGGRLFEHTSSVPFLLCATFMLLPLLVLGTQPNALPPEPGAAAPVRRADARSRWFWALGLAANFSNFCMLGVNRTLFPKLGLSTGLTPAPIGMLGFVISLSQLSMFLLLRMNGFWRYRMWPVVLAQTAGAAAMLAIAAGEGAMQFAAAYVLLGLGAGMCYNASLYYSLHAGQGGRGSSIHETNLAGAQVFGPLVGGAVAELVPGDGALRAPFLVIGGLVLAAVAVELLVIPRRLAAREEA